MNIKTKFGIGDLVFIIYNDPSCLNTLNYSEVKPHLYVDDTAFKVLDISLECNAADTSIAYSLLVTNDNNDFINDEEAIIEIFNETSCFATFKEAQEKCDEINEKAETEERAKSGTLILTQLETAAAKRNISVKEMRRQDKEAMR